MNLKNNLLTVRWTLTFIIGTIWSVFSCQAINPPFVIKHLGDGQSIVQIENQKKFLLLPVEEAAPEAKLYMIADNDVVRNMNVRLAINKVDYFVPVDLSGFDNKSLSFNFQLIPDTAICWDEMKLSNEFDTSNRESFRPLYHFTPQYGWMNDPNGMVYKDGVYHLFYQYNPYGSMWGNMHWGHATSTDLVNWEHQPIAIAPDALGTIFSGSCVVDKDNTAGFGAGAIIAFYTSASDRQVQSMAYSLDNGKTFKKYARNPILTSTQRDFRDPKVFWHDATDKWIMILAVGQEMQIYSSANLKDWAYESSFGEGQGAHGGVWECPDLIELPIEGTELKKWVLICNINPGGPFGGSATQYFVGTFDGKKFVNESPKNTKWMDWGKDHYATVCFSNTGNRVVAVPWMSNWQYCNIVPTRQFRSANALPRELGLYTQDNDIYLSAAPVAETKNLRKESKDIPSFTVDKDYHIESLLTDNEGTYELSLNIKTGKAEIMGFSLFNDKGEKVDIYLNLPEKKLVMDRTKSGIVDFGKNSSPHEIEAHDRRKTISINYIDDFALATWAPIKKEDEYKLDVFVDKCSVEIFLDGGKIAMTNLIFPTEPYNRMCFYSKGGTFAVDSFSVHRLGL